MIPIVISKGTQTLSHQELKDLIETTSFDFYTYGLDSQDEIISRASNLEEYSMEALMRIFEAKYGYRPLQNKIYERVEAKFKDQDAYNINRMFSSLRRVAFLKGLDLSDEKYCNWFKNRVRYASFALVRTLKDVEYIQIPSLDELESECVL